MSSHLERDSLRSASIGQEFYFIRGIDKENKMIHVVGKCYFVGIYDFVMPFDVVYQSFLDQSTKEYDEDYRQQCLDAFRKDKEARKVNSFVKFISENGKIVWSFQGQPMTEEAFEYICEKHKDYLVINVEVSEFPDLNLLKDETSTSE